MGRISVPENYLENKKEKKSGGQLKQRTKKWSARSIDDICMIFCE